MKEKRKLQEAEKALKLKLEAEERALKAQEELMMKLKKEKELLDKNNKNLYSQKEQEKQIQETNENKFSFLFNQIAKSQSKEMNQNGYHNKAIDYDEPIIKKSKTDVFSEINNSPEDIFFVYVIYNSKIANIAL